MEVNYFNVVKWLEEKEKQGDQKAFALLSRIREGEEKGEPVPFDDFQKLYPRLFEKLNPENPGLYKLSSGAVGGIDPSRLSPASGAAVRSEAEMFDEYYGVAGRPDNT